jgi:hypothetical protein
LSFDVFGFVSRAFQEALEEFLQGLKNEFDALDIPNAEERVSAAREKFNKGWYFPCLNAHWNPLRRVVGILSVDEMAELAETLINLEALKERVTKPTESVGGPVDVAAITKNEGFVWIKRKHYFPAELNPRYFARRFH